MSEKTEQPTAKRLREARDEGNVAKSKDFTQALLIAALFGYTIGNGPAIMTAFAEMIVLPPAGFGAPLRQVLDVVGGQILRSAAAVLLPFLLIVLVVGAFAELLQTGVMFAFKALKPSMKKINPATNAKNIFAMKNLVEFLKSILKIAFLSALVFVLVRGSLDALMKMPLGDIAGVGQATAQLLKQLVLYTVLAFVVVAGFDFAYQRFQWKKGLMMSKDEVHREYKEMEGDPHVKSHRRALAQEIAMGDNVARTRTASVVVTNPTHIAVALHYDDAETPLPVVVAKGENLVAAQMVKAAEEAGIPVMRDVPLAHALLETAAIDQYVPSELLEPVAEILRAVRALRQKETTP